MKNVILISKHLSDASNELVCGYLSLIPNATIRDYAEVNIKYSRRVALWLKNPVGPKPAWGE